MNLLRRYCLRELTYPFLISLFLVAFIFMAGNLLISIVDLLVNKGVGIFDVLKLIMLSVPSVLGFIMPTSALASVLLVFGSFAQNNEIIAMKASGIHIFRLFIPVIGVAFLLSLFSLFLIDQIEPRSEYAYRQLIRSLVVKRPAAYLEAGRFIKDFEGYTFWINSIKGNRLEGVTVFQYQEAKPTRTILAERGEIISAPDQKSFALRLYNGTSDEPNPENPSVLYKLNFKTFLLSNIATGKKKGGAGKKEKEMTIDELLYQLKYNEEAKRTAKKRREIESEIHKKISFSFGTLIFVLVGLPTAIISRRGDIVVSFLVAITVVATYYGLFVWGRIMSIDGYLPPWIALWLPNAILLGIAAFLTRKMIRL
ncbi:MAG: LptF/LptG family permease [Candidatus Omnitrophica bacterium]|nr:LptF/LptG family permease [Candidatus Omnitrophota bacterium]